MTPIVRVVRDGVVEAEHHVAAAAADPAGNLLVEAGDVHRMFYARSSAKPFQLAVGLELGVEMSDQHIAVACSSHGGFPVHIAYIRSILRSAQLDESALQTPPAWPYSEAARDLWIRKGTTKPLPIFHNCSGKHAAMLAACRRAGWPTDTYLDPDHPLQQLIRARWSKVTGWDIDSVGVDGCGAPVSTVSVATLAVAYSRLATRTEYRRIWWAMHRYPALASENGRIDTRIATAVDAAAKIGAEACIGVAIRNRFGAAAKCWDGALRGLEGGIIGCLRGLGSDVGSTAAQLEPGPPVLGGGVPHGEIRPIEATSVR